MNAVHQLDLRRINCNGNFLYDLVEKLNGTAHIKDAQTGKYIYSNHFHSASLNLDPTDSLIGLHSGDILSQDSRFYKNLEFNQNILAWLEYERNKTEEIDYQVKLTKRACQIQSIYLMVDSSLQFERSIKLPIQNQENQKTIAILTFTEDITYQLGLRRLLQLYQEFYSRNQSVKKFLKHLKIETYFNPSTPPTLKEVQILCAMREDNSIKYVARAMGISPATVSNHISQLKDKLLEHHYLHEIIIKVRSVPTVAYKYEFYKYEFSAFISP
jgi:DNA-binding CsgD family transcriptional regulator